MLHYEDLIERLRKGTGLPVLQALMNEAADAIEEMAASRGAPPGKWEEEEKNGVWEICCSACGSHIPRGKWGQPWHSVYCPSCGAKMEE